MSKEAEEAYEYVLADLKQAIGFRKKPMKNARRLLKTRLKEIREIWSIPDDQWLDPTDDNDVAKLAKLVDEIMAPDLDKCNTDIVDDINKRLSKFDNPESND
jgi:hypothetical protein